MDRDQLVAFDRIAREGSFTRAGITLGIGQPAVSARIQALEGHVGGALFVRGRRVALTALGETFLPFARRALEVLGEGIESARLAQVGQRGRVRVASLASLAGGLVGPALSALVRARPGVDCLARAGDHERVVALLLDGIVELGLVTWPCAEAEAAELQPLLELREPVVLVARPDHPLARAARVDEAQLVRLGRPLLRLRWWQKHHPLLVRLADRTGTHVDVPMEVGRHLALAGAAVGFFAQTYVSDDLSRGDLVTVEVAGLPRLHRDSALVRRRRSGALSPAAAGLVEALRLEARRLGLLAAVARPGRAVGGAAGGSQGSRMKARNSSRVRGRSV